MGSDTVIFREAVQSRTVTGLGVGGGQQIEVQVLPLLLASPVISFIKIIRTATFIFKGIYDGSLNSVR